jgi:hypothetical protein
MKCKEAKARIKKLERENYKLRHRKQKSIPEDRRYDFNLLEIVVRPKNRPMVRYDICDIDLRVLGDPAIKIPDICTYKTIQMAAIHFIKENRRDFIKRIGEIMARELVDFADKNVPEIAK